MIDKRESEADNLSRHVEKLQGIIHARSDVMDILKAARDCDPPQWVVGAGLIRNVVWDHLHVYQKPTPFKDVDVAFFDPSDLGRDREKAIEKDLSALLPGVPWDVTNQAAVHLWYEEKFGYPVDPLTSVEEAVATWPETCTSVAVRLLPDDDLLVIAPLGLGDLLDMVLRRNPRRATAEIFRQRVRDKGLLDGWPRVRMIDE